MPSKRRSSLFSMRGHHVAIRVPDFEASKRWFVQKLDFRVHKVWTFKNRKHAYLTPATDETLHIEILGGAPLTRPETRPRRSYVDLKDSLRNPGYHHFCLTVDDIDKTIAELQRRGVTIVAKPFDIKAIKRRLAFFADPWGNLMELAQVIPRKTQPKLNKRGGMPRSG
jgi:glyoxylase I family protein